MISVGTRWSSGDEPPTRLPQAVIDAVLDIEGDLAEQNVNTSMWYWTLTWLEGRPVVEFDDGTRIDYDPDTDEVTVSQSDEYSDDDA
ncbi:hypothetical protein [Subtercola boreus]|uniref:hypothetical protein n=1 Tax=Subtercola boreus TaxID=120213 RepID=UPI00209C0D94|nr:hypothetical protein [Subtercola boreus]